MTKTKRITVVIRKNQDHLTPLYIQPFYHPDLHTKNTPVTVQATEGTIAIAKKTSRANHAPSTDNIRYAYSDLPTKTFTHKDGTTTTYQWNPTALEWKEI